VIIPPDLLGPVTCTAARIIAAPPNPVATSSWGDLDEVQAKTAH
jgi:hypothetical protein